ncbi:MAG: hypothetical protein ACO2ZP_00520 [Bacteriovoracaceae bacterium]
MSKFILIILLTLTNTSLANENECLLIEDNDEFYECEEVGVEEYFKCEDLEGEEFDACTDQA